MMATPEAFRPCSLFRWHQWGKWEDTAQTETVPIAPGFVMPAPVWVVYPVQTRRCARCNMVQSRICR